VTTREQEIGFHPVPVTKNPAGMRSPELARPAHFQISDVERLDEHSANVVQMDENAVSVEISASGTS